MKLKIFIIGIIMSLPLTAGGEDMIPLSISSAVEKAAAVSEELRIQDENLKKMINTYKEVRSAAFPQLTGDVGWSKYIKSPVMRFDLGDGPVEIPVKQKYEANAGATLSQILLAFGKVGTAIDIARRSIDIEKLSYDTARNELVFSVKQAYYTVLYAQDALTIAEDSYNNALKNEQALRMQVRSGRASRYDNIKIAADVAGRFPTVINATKTMEQITISFKSLVGLRKEHLVQLTDALKKEFSPCSYETLNIVMMEQNPVLRILKSTISLNDRMIQLRKADFYPTLSGFASYNYTGNGNNLIPRDEMQSEVIAGLRLGFTIWDSGRLGGAYRQAVNGKEIAELEYQKTVKELDVALSSAVTEYNSLIESYEAYKKALKFAEDLYSISLSSFKSGSATISQLNDAEIQLTGSRLGTLHNLYQLHILNATIDALVGQESL